MLAQWLEINDRVKYIGLDFEGKIHLEGLLVEESIQRNRPICSCGTRMKSMGANQGVRCPNCKTKSSTEWATSERVPPYKGWVQPPSDKRRHLARTMT